MLVALNGRVGRLWYRWLLVGVLSAMAVGGGVARAQSDVELVVATFEVEPFVERRGEVPGGFLFEVWEQVAAELGWDYEVVWIESLTDMGDVIRAGGADVGVAPLSSTSSREEVFDFTTGVVASGPMVGVHERTENPVSLASALISVDILKLLGWSAVGLLVLSHMMWQAERRTPHGDFAPGYGRGVWDGLWWAMVTVTTIGYGDKSPRTTPGRLVAMLAMLGSLFLVGAFVSEVTTALQSQRAAQVVSEVGDLEGRPVAVVEGSSYEAFLEERGVNTVGYPTQLDAFVAAEAGEVDVVVADRYSLDALGADYGIRGTGDLLYDEFIGFAVPEDSPLRSDINGALSDLHQQGRIREIVDHWTK